MLIISMSFDMIKYANRLKEPTVTTTSFYKNQIIRSSTKIEK